MPSGGTAADQPNGQLDRQPDPQPRSRFAWCVTGSGHSDEALRVLGEELSKRVVQKYVYQRLIDEMRARQFVIVEEEIDSHQAIRLKVRHWEN